jgi:hypothetical protein
MALFLDSSNLYFKRAYFIFSSHLSPLASWDSILSLSRERAPSKGVYEEQMRGDGKNGYFRHGGGVIKVLYYLMGVDMQTPKPRNGGLKEDQPPILLVPLARPSNELQQR